MSELHSLSNQALLEKTRTLVKEERELTTRILHHLREVERRKLFSDLGYPSLFAYAMGDLHYSESSASRRISAMRLLKEFPELDEKIESGSLSLSVIAQAQTFFRQEGKIEKVTTQEKREILFALENKSTREAEKELLARSSEPERLRPETIKPVSQTLSELRCLVDQKTLENLERIRGLLGHTHSEMTLSELIANMAEITLEKIDPARETKRARKIAEESPRESAKEPVSGGENSEVPQLVSARKPNEENEHVAAEVIGASSKVQSTLKRREYIGAKIRREIWQRANKKCSLCGSAHRLQIDHIQPLALGGTNAKENLRLLCFHCNQRQAIRQMGSGAMERYRGRGIPEQES